MNEGEIAIEPGIEQQTLFLLRRCGHDVHQLRQEPTDPPPLHQHHEPSVRDVGRLRVRQVLPQPQDQEPDRQPLGRREAPSPAGRRHLAEGVRRLGAAGRDDGRVEGRAGGQPISFDLA